jgi:hypothetical protein
MVFYKLDNDKLDVKPTSLSEFLAQNPQIQSWRRSLRIFFN